MPAKDHRLDREYVTESCVLTKEQFINILRARYFCLKEDETDERVCNGSIKGVLSVSFGKRFYPIDEVTCIATSDGYIFAVTKDKTYKLYCLLDDSGIAGYLRFEHIILEPPQPPRYIPAGLFKGWNMPDGSILEELPDESKQEQLTTPACR